MRFVNNSSSFGKRVAESLRHFLPRSRSKTIFLVVMACYKVVFNRIITDVIGLGYYWRELGESLAAGLHPMRQISGMYFLTALLVAPVFESAFAIAIIEAVRKLHGRVIVQVIVSVSLVSAIHSIPYVFHGVAVVPLVLIDVATYLYWRRRSVWTGVWMMIGVHALYNAYAVLHTLSYRAGQ